MSSEALTVLYDGGCGLCGREIRHYRRLRALASIDWVDATAEPERLAEFGVDLAEAMAEFHVYDAQRRLRKGADGFLLLWSVLPYYRILPKLARFFHLEPALRALYARFARWHFRRRCADGACSV